MNSSTEIIVIMVTAAHILCMLTSGFVQVVYVFPVLKSSFIVLVNLEAESIQQNMFALSGKIEVAYYSKEIVFTCII